MSFPVDIPLEFLFPPLDPAYLRCKHSPPPSISVPAASSGWILSHQATVTERMSKALQKGFPNVDEKPDYGEDISRGCTKTSGSTYSRDACLRACYLRYIG